MKILLPVFLSVLGSIPLWGQVYDLNRPEYWKSKQITAAASDRGTVFTIRGEAWPTAGGFDLMEIDPARTYVFSAEIRTAAGKPGLAELGFWLFDANRQPIRYVQIGGIPATDTVLAEPCSKGDRRIKVQSAGKFRRGGGSIAFDVKAGIRQEPWPESDLVSGIGKISRSGSCDIVELKNPVQKDYPAGTRIRQFQQASHFHCWRGRPSAEWTPVSGRIAGISADHAEKGKWWPTARFFRIRIAANIAAGKDSVTEIRNIRLEIVRPSYF